MGDEGAVMETRDLILRKAVYEDWKSMYLNVWSRPETARYMVWRVTADEVGAKERIERTIAWQKTHDAWLVCVKDRGEAVGFGGVKRLGPDSWGETGIALGPEYVGRGYGRQVLLMMMKYCRSLGGREFFYSTRAANEASRALALCCGLVYGHSEQRIDPRNGEVYEAEIYRKDLRTVGG
ncbi:MAG: GNAT family N-acetyltransferase [Hungatella sp.]|nr:GNAT family N-acetyltransferase [Hungatella sp.]